MSIHNILVPNNLTIYAGNFIAEEITIGTITVDNIDVESITVENITVDDITVTNLTVDNLTVETSGNINNLTVTGTNETTDLTVTNDLEVNGTATINNLTVLSQITLDELEVGDLTVTGPLTVAGLSTFNGEVETNNVMRSNSILFNSGSDQVPLDKFTLSYWNLSIFYNGGFVDLITISINVIGNLAFVSFPFLNFHAIPGDTPITIVGYPATILPTADIATSMLVYNNDAITYGTFDLDTMGASRITNSGGNFTGDTVIGFSRQTIIYTLS